MEVEIFWDNISVMGEFRRFYEKYPNPPSRCIYTEAEKNLSDILELKFLSDIIRV